MTVLSVEDTPTDFFVSACRYIDAVIAAQKKQQAAEQRQQERSRG